MCLRRRLSLDQDCMIDQSGSLLSRLVIGNVIATPRRLDAHTFSVGARHHIAMLSTFSSVGVNKQFTGKRAVT